MGKRPYAGRVVVIVDGGVRSAGETLLGSFKEDGRGWMIGESPTAGMSSSKETLELPSGLFSIYFSVHSNKARFNGGKGVEGIGVVPHEIVPFEAKDLAAGVDTQIRRAEEILARFPDGKVPYKPPR
jgi:C-terminal processing protease CtpA/Prc